MKFFKRNWGNILFLIALALLFIPQTRMPIQVFLQRLISFSPSEIKEDKQVVLEDYAWELSTLEGSSIQFSDSKGKVMLINFWASWCPPCIAEMPSLQNLYDIYGDRVDFYFVTNEDPSIVKRFMNKKGYSFPVFIQTEQAPMLLRSETLPTTFLISDKGEIKIKKLGVAAWDSDSMKKIMDGLLSKLP
jgi:thiol-disulfide isomerase/thioredoxin